MITLKEKILKTDQKLALFDYDGTIVDSAIMIVKGAIEAFRACGIPDPDPIKVKENIGKPLAVALKEYMPLGYNVPASKISDAYKNWYAEQGRLGLQNEPLFPGMYNLLEQLKETGRWQLGIATNKSRIALENGLAKHKLSKFFDLTLTTDENKPKPDPDMAIMAMKEMDQRNNTTFIIGDTVNDIGLGKNANITAIGVSWGYNDEEILKKAGAKEIVHNAKQLYELLQSNLNYEE